MTLFQTTLLFLLTAMAEIAGCYLPYLWLRRGASVLFLVPGAVSLALFAWLLSLHPTGAGRTYAAYGGVYVATALVWLRIVEQQPITRWDAIGAAISISGMAVIVLGNSR